ncbi:MAG TPA: 3-oxo-tetronate kinase, partial [Rubrivivax sp.]|nr:3-oxo-tetronate kinase [Rubrivivax sp.]
NNLVRSGMRTLQTIGVPDGPLALAADAVVVALKSRTIPAREAVAQALTALRWLQAQGAQQIYFKYCSTFDSTPLGNIGPVAEALMQALDCDFTIATPAFPDNGRTVFKGHLFVGDVLLHESGMQDHPLTPMRDPNLVRVLQAQCLRRVGLIDHRTVAGGEVAVRQRMAQMRAEGVALAIVDAVSNDDLLRLGAALKGLPLVTGGSGVALGLPQNWGFAADDRAARLPAASGARAVVSGSCSSATQRQVAAFIAAGHPALTVDPLRLAKGADVVGEALAWAIPRLGQGPLLICSTADPAAVQEVQGQLGAGEAGALVEGALAAIARGLVERGVRQLVIAGGETSGACVQKLGIRQLQIGPQIDPGVPWCHAASEAVAGPGLHIALKSGNFGVDDFFARAFRALA